MITEQDRLDAEKSIDASRKLNLLKIVEASERYDRLMTNRDFLQVLQDLRDTADIHTKEIDYFVHELVDTDSVFKRMRIESVIIKHRIRRDQLEEAINRPNVLIQMAREARKELAVIYSKEKTNAQ